MRNPLNAPTLSLRDDKDRQWTTRLIRVLPEIQEDISPYNSCIEYCKCTRRIDLQEDGFYFDITDYPVTAIFCSAKCARDYSAVHVSRGGDPVDLDDYIVTDDINFDSVDPLDTLSQSERRKILEQSQNLSDSDSD